MAHAEFAVGVVSDRPQEVANFYAAHFGLEETSNVGWFISLRRPGASWEVTVSELGHPSLPAAAGERPDGVVLAVVTQDAAADAARLEAAGVALLEPLRDEPWGQRHFYVQDPAGTVIDVVQFTTPSPEWLAEHGLA